MSEATTEDFSEHAPECCGQPMEYIGSCSEGCCDYYRCKICHEKTTIEYDG